MRILMLAAECAPFAKTGGLADVVGALPRVLRAMGHDVIVVMPKYEQINYVRYGLNPTMGPLGVWMGDTQEWCQLHMTVHDDVPVYFVESHKYFSRPGLYHDAAFNDYADNPRRFGLLTRAGLQLCQDTGFAPDIVHAHDWHTALAPAYLKIWHWNDPVLGGAASVLTIHNIAYQGVYGAEHMDYLGLQWANFTPDTFEDYGRINFLKGGIQYADVVNTVSPTYADETRTPEGGYGLAPYLNDKGDRYVGILNGVDYAEWSPQSDTRIPARYDAGDMAGKAVCKRALQERLGLEARPDIALIGAVSRLVEQKGLDLLAQALDGILNTMHVQFALLGSGGSGLERFYGELPGRYPGRAGSYIGYSDDLAHLIEAGADFFIMPSRFEPCGLNQIYSLRYGTLPIVRATGGLDDTVQQYDEATGEGTGFKFDAASPAAIADTVGWAVSTYYDRPHHMRQLIRRAMAQDYSWERSAVAYVALYERAIAVKSRTT
jgi:starch synthase